MGLCSGQAEGRDAIDGLAIKMITVHIWILYHYQFTIVRDDNLIF